MSASDASGRWTRAPQPHISPAARYARHYLSSSTAPGARLSRQAAATRPSSVSAARRPEWPRDAPAVEPSHLGEGGSERTSVAGSRSSSVAVVCYRAVRAVALRARAEATGYLAIPLLLRMEGRSEPVGSTLRNSLVFAGFGVCLHQRPQQRRIGRGVADRPPRRRDGGSGAHPPLPHRVTTCSSSRPRGQPLAVGGEVFRQP